MTQYTIYKGLVTVNPISKKLEAQLCVNYVIKEASANCLGYVIYDDSQLEITGELIESVELIEHQEVSPFILGQKLIRIQLSQTVKAGASLSLNFDYTLDFSNFKTDFMNCFDSDYMELGLYTPWYPLNVDFEACLYDLEFSVPETHYVVGATLLPNGHWRLSQEKNPHCGIEFIIGLKGFQSLKNDFDKPIHMHWFSADDGAIGEHLYTDVLEAVSYFTDKFGASGKDHLDIALVPRKNTESSGGYCRPNLIVIPMGENQHNNSRYSSDKYTYILEYMLHEVAHLWWSKADCQSFEDWLNESFAEYSKYMAIRKLFGDARHAEIFERLQSKAETMPSLCDENLSSDEQFEVMRVKGPVVLYGLEKKIGKERMTDLLKEIHQNKVNTTEEVISLIGRNYTDKTAIFFKNLL